MKVYRVLVLLLFFVILSDGYSKESKEVYFEGMKRSIIQWDKIDPGIWLNLNYWKENLQLKESNSNWDQIQRNKLLKEKMGRSIQCVGECVLYRGKGYNNIRYGSLIREGDEVQTGEDSYLWIFLTDGTLVRMSPDTSISFFEINLGIKEFFLSVRINYGNALWISRDSRSLKKTDLKETDSIFLPLDFFEANPKKDKIRFKENTLYAALREPQTNKRQYVRLNNYITRNNKRLALKPTHSFIIMPNGSVSGLNLQMEFIVLDGDVSFFKHRTPEDFGIKLKKDQIGQSKPEDEAMLHFRGFNNTNVSKIDYGSWFMVDPTGQQMTKVDDEKSKKFSIGEFLTKRIPTILMARELMLQKYSRFLYMRKWKAPVLASSYGYRLWGRIGSEFKEDLYKRFQFIKEYSRRVETTWLKEKKKFTKEINERGENLTKNIYSDKYYIRAIKSYYFKRERAVQIPGDWGILNSTKNPLWEKIQNK